MKIVNRAGQEVYGFHLSNTMKGAPQMWVNFVQFANPNSSLEDEPNVDRLLEEQGGKFHTVSSKYRGRQPNGRFITITRERHYVEFANERDLILFMVKWA